MLSLLMSKFIGVLLERLKWWYLFWFIKIHFALVLRLIGDWLMKFTNEGLPSAFCSLLLFVSLFDFK